MAKSTRDRILDAAEARFAEKGFSATSLGEIADDVGIRTPSLYKHFATKKHVYQAVLARLLDPYVEMLEGLLVTPRDAGQAQLNLETVAQHYYERPNLARLVQHAALAGGDEIEMLMKRWFDPFFRRAAQLTPALPSLRRRPSPGKREARGGGSAEPWRGRAPEQRIFLVMAFHNLMSGYVTMAPLHRRLLGEDPLGKRARTRHLDFLKDLARALWVAPHVR
jgi:AcrR family transcriptional regulator